MWTEEEIDALLNPLRSAQSDTQSIEIKEAVGGLPVSLAETISAFANGTGGTIILGISEHDDFSPVQGFQAKPIAEALAQMCRDKITPPLQPLIDIATYHDSAVVIAVIDEADPLSKPCYVRTRGQYSGSFIRVWDGDRKLSHYEIDRLLENRAQPTHDRALVEEATISDLLPDLLQSILAARRKQSPRIFGNLSDEEALQSLGIVKADSTGTLRPTVAGLLVAGNYPQQFMPRVNITFTCYPGYDKVFAGGVKFIDNCSFDGPIPEILDNVLNSVRKNMRIGGVLDGPFRKDTYEYPEDAVREAVVNAIMHRDYSPMAQGGQIQVNMYKDRLEILNPGGLYGDVTLQSLSSPGATSTRNQTLAKLLECTPFHGGMVAENRGTGYSLINHLLQDNGNGEPEIYSTLNTFCVTFRSADTSQLPDSRRDPRYAKWSDRPDVDYSAKQGSSPRESATTPRPKIIPFPQSAVHGVELSDQEMYDRYAKGVPGLDEAYARILNVQAKAFASSGESTLEETLIRLLMERGVVQTPELVKDTGAPRSTVTYQLRKMLDKGIIERTQPARSPKQSYRLKTA
ncbi:putative DNA binding domain-containing protein [Bifidobacterium imperatoris]|uniref:ATP-dependent DNA helicase recG C-terminal n=1 Tax=Bifidobacterium imperatoris TaxID=2020965 RepID=A0A2N5IUE5_9BIFI|nr:ATP-binding protein [Bifidobacterium imperatoris]PLS25582.1 ATP-dependent DNA helicase recG C-terminal [Bifidobacterium imperatoris]QSY57144.1 putative DNA binding domain-containing protein [Bifidobacterium imperatoris]